MKIPMQSRAEAIEFDNARLLPDIDVRFTACRSGKNGYIYDIVDFLQRRIDRWTVPFIQVAGGVEAIGRTIYPVSLPLGYTDPQAYCDEQYMTPHVVQLAPQGKLFAAFGVAENGFGVLVIDTVTGRTEFATADAGDVRLYVSTGDFDAEYSKWYFSDWPTTNSRRDEEGGNSNAFSIRCLDIETLEQESLYELTDTKASLKAHGVGLPKRIHQVTLSNDKRHLVCSPFDYDPNIPYPQCPPADDPEGFRRTHEGGMKLEYLLTIDFVEQRHWFTQIPVPVPAHMEFDPVEENVIYASAHNIAAISVGTMLEGPAALYKLAIGDGETKIVGAYSDPGFFRITQHSIFRYRTKTLIAVTCVPNRLVIVDGETMALWRDVEIFAADPIVLGGGGVLSPEYGQSCYSVNPSTDGRYIVMEDARNFIIYDMDADEILKDTVPRQIPAGYVGRGHTRTASQ